MEKRQHLWATSCVVRRGLVGEDDTEMLQLYSHEHAGMRICEGQSADQAGEPERSQGAENIGQRNVHYGRENVKM